ncbi:MAG: hypothetical protein GY882_03455, partial [Actinomycetia bacterium]|nr:hypothetical protein [Actinomycetes bacterium]
MSAPVLVIAEKPSLGRTICSALGGQMGKPFVFNGETLIVVAAAGHLIEMLDPEGHDAKWGGDWNHASLPIIPTKLKYKPRDRRAAETLKGFKDLVAEHGITEAISAGDAAREGSHIVALIWSRYLNQPMANCRRAWFHSLTPEALRDAFTNLKAPEFDVGLAAAAECRSRADYVLGMSASRAASIQLRAKGGISVGRVQTPTLAFVVDADRQRLGHTAGVYYKVTGTALDIDVEWREALGSDVDRFDTRPPADAVAAATAGHGTVAAFDAKTTSHKAPHLFDLTALQRTANTAFSWTATRTLEVAQGLYERGILSYPRSDSAFLPSDMADEFHTWVTANLPKGASADMVDVSVVCDDSKVSDHYAIVPAGPGAGLNGDDKKLFDLVAKRCAAACLPAHTVDRQVLWVEANGHFFRGALARTATPGWTLAEGNRATDTLIAVPAVGSPAPLADVAVTEGTAKTPPKMTEARLLKLMTTAGRDLDDDELVAAMGESGIGTPA